jgi:hypothetical protein
MSFVYPHVFEGAIDRFGVGRARKIWYTVLFLPSTFEDQLPFAAYPRLRVDGEIADFPVTGAWMPTGDGRRYFIVAPRVLKEGGIHVGDVVEMRFRIGDQDAVDVPTELALALEADPVAKMAWVGLSAGKQRGMTHRIHPAKAPETRAKRVSEVLKILLEQR